MGNVTNTGQAESAGRNADRLEGRHPRTTGGERALLKALPLLFPVEAPTDSSYIYLHLTEGQSVLPSGEPLAPDSVDAVKSED